jgi:cathepsin C
MRAGGRAFEPVRDSLTDARASLADVDAGHDVSDLPEKWDWRDVDGVNYLFEPQDQGQCGSCYAFATIDMIQTRIAIKSRNRLRRRLAVQDILSCGKYSQGCKGGFPYLAAKYVNDFGVSTQSCMPYRASTGRCMANKSCARTNRAYIKGYRYVGGYFGGCTERAMMLEIMRNGPIALGFEVSQQLMHYSKGVFVAVPDLVGRSKWQPSNHAVLAIGWGKTETGVPYWIAKNSWGHSWGESGYFRIVRGRDAANFESMAVAADVEVPAGWLRAQERSRQADADVQGDHGADEDADADLDMVDDALTDPAQE